MTSYEQTILKHYTEDIAFRISARVSQLIDALHELDRMTQFLFAETRNDSAAVDEWLKREQFAVDEDGFFQSVSLLEQSRLGRSLPNAISCSWGKHLASDDVVRFRMFALRNMGKSLVMLRERLPYAAWIYYQDVTNTAIQYPFIDQKTAITWDFDWHQYHTFLSVSPSTNPAREIRWTQPSIDYAGEGLIISVSKPVYQGEQFTGLWSIDVPVQNLHNDCIGKQLFIDQKTFVVDKSGLFIFHPEIPLLIEKSRGSIFREKIDFLGDGFKELTQERLVEQQGVPFFIRSKQETFVACANRIDSIDWTLISTVPQRILADAVSRRLETVIRNIKAGDLTARVNGETLPEHWQPLVDALNDMSESLEESRIKEQHLNAVIRSVRKINQLIIAEKNAVALVQNACDILVETREYRHVWIGLVDEYGRFDRVVEAGLGDAFSPLRNMLNLSLTPEYCLSALACPDIVITRANDERAAFCPVAKSFPGTDKLTVRLYNDGLAYGILSITAQPHHADDKEELSLVRQLAGDIGLALRGIDLEVEQQKTSDALRLLNLELEERVRDRTCRLQTANDELEAFSYSVSHDLRAPLRAIGGFSSILLEDYKDKLDGEGVASLERITAAVLQMGQLIDDLLRLSRVTRTPIRSEVVNLSSTAEAIIESMRQEDSTRDIEVRITPNLTAVGDPALLHVVMQNLLENAWKFTSNTKAAQIVFSRQEDFEGGYFFVQDNGAGFDMAYADKLFEAFQRIHNNEQFPGNGVGLAAASRAIRRHGGVIWGKGEVGKGATFGFTLPSPNRNGP